MVESPRFPARLAGGAFIFLAFFIPIMAVPAPRALALFLPVMTLFCLPMLWVNRSQINWRPLILPVLLLLAFLISGWLRSPVPVRALRYALTGVGVITFGWMLWQAALMLSEVQKFRTLRTLRAGVLMGVVMVVAEYLLGQPITHGLASLTGGKLPELYVVDRGIIILSLLLWPLIAAARLSSLVIYLLVIVATLLMSATSSQAATVALPFGFIVYLLVSHFPILASRLVRLGTILLFLAMPFFIYLLNLVFTGDAVIWQAANAGVRLGIWTSASIHILSQPWLGYGIEASTVLTGLTNNIHTHNGILQIWLEWGLVGAMMALVGMLALLRKIEGRPAMQAAYASWLLVFCVGYDIWQPWWITTAVILIVLFSLTPQPQPARS